MMGRAFIRDKQPWEGGEAAGLGRGLRPSVDEAPAGPEWLGLTLDSADGWQGRAPGAEAGLCGWGHTSFV